MLKKTAIVAALLFTALPSNADQLNWNKYRASYVTIDAPDSVYSPSGFALSTTQMINDDVFASAEFTFVNDNAVIDGIATDNDTTYFDLALGIKHTYKESTDFYTAVAVETYQNDFFAEANDQSKSDIGYSFSLGVRKLFYNHWEVHLSTSRVIYSGDGRWENRASFAYHLNENLSWEFSFIKNKYSNTIVLGGAVGF